MTDRFSPTNRVISPRRVSVPGTLSAAPAVISPIRVVQPTRSPVMVSPVRGPFTISPTRGAVRIVEPVVQPPIRSPIVTISPTRSPVIVSPIRVPTIRGLGREPGVTTTISPEWRTMTQEQKMEFYGLPPTLESPPRQTRRTPTDAELYEAATQPINIFAGNRPRWSIYQNPKTIEPSKIEYFGFEAYRIYDPQNPNRMFSVATKDGLGRETTRQFKIAFTRWGWNNKGPLVLINHGVPANQSQWWDIARLLAMVGFRVITFDMLTMGWSSKPLFSNQEKLEKLRWIHDKYYVDWLADYIFGRGTKFVYLADDWGTGILHKYMENHSDRLLWAGDQDGIRGGAYPVPEIEVFGQASMAPMDERPEVLAGKAPPRPGSFQMAMAAANQTITQILKTMAHRQHEKYDQWSMRPTLRPFFSVDYERNDLDPRGAAAPFNMPNKNYALKSMADRAVSALRSGDLQPYHPTKNKGGIKFTQIKTNFLLWHGEYDNMMARNQRLRYKYWMSNSHVLTQLIPRAGHFSGLDQPEWIATMIIEFHSFLFPPGKPNSLPEVFLGFDGIFKGNEEKEAPAYKQLYT